MKLSPRGFTLVELMIVIAIIGILAAALFPALSGYISRSRDTSRIAHLSQIMSAASSLFQDKNSYDTIMTPTGCVNSGALNTYMGGTTPTDQDKTRDHGCGTLASYGAGTGTTLGTYTVAVSAKMENSGYGNTGSVLTSFLTGGQNMNTYGAFSKGYGVGYVIVR